MPTGDGDRPTGRDQTRSGNVTAIDRRGEHDVEIIRGACAAGGGDPGFEGPPGIARPKEHGFASGGVDCQFDTVAPLDFRVEQIVDVAVDETRKKGHPGHCGKRGIGRSRPADRSHMHDVTTLRPDLVVLAGVGRDPVNQPLRSEDDRCCLHLDSHMALEIDCARW